MMQTTSIHPTMTASIETVSRGPYGLLKPGASLFFRGYEDGPKCKLIVKDEAH